MIADDGNHASYISLVAPNGALGAALGSVWVAARTPGGGWKSTDANQASFLDIINTMAFSPKAFSPDFSREAVESNVRFNADDADDISDSFLLEVGTGRAKWLSPGLTLPDATTGFVRDVGAPTDLSRVVWTGQAEAFVPGAPANGVYSSDGQTVRAESILPDGSFGQSSDAVGYGFEWGYIAGPDPIGRPSQDRTDGSFVAHGGRHVVSDDGSRVFFRDNGAVYVRINDASPRTVAVTSSQRVGDVGTVHTGQFLAADHAGTTVSFASTDQLTDTATVGGGIYRYNIESDALTQVTPDANDPAGLQLSAAIVSDDQSRIYFTSPAALAGTTAQAGNNNAYVWSAQGVRFIAALAPTDRFARVSRDGRFALIEAVAQIGSAPNNGYQAVYEYDYAADRVVCVSCRQDGTMSEAGATLDEQVVGFPSQPFTAPRGITDDGTVVFATRDRLVPADQTGALDVYLYREGRLSLLTAGRGDDDSYAADVSDDGRNVFVLTRSPLVKQDTDPAELDLYDIRVDGGFLSPAPPPAVVCRGDDCQGPVVQNSPPVQPASTRPSRRGNVTPEKVAPKVSASRLTTAQRSTLARTGRVTLSVRVSGGGKVSVVGRGRVGGKTTTVGRGSTVVLKKGATLAKVTFRLTQAARRELARRHRLTVAFTTRLAGLKQVVRSTATLKRSR